jgi:hypothetical protein
MTFWRSLPDNAKSNFAPALDRAGQGERTHGAAQGAGDEIAGIAQPDEIFRRQSEGIWKKGVQARIDAGQRDHRQGIGKIPRMQAGGRIAGDSPVVGVQDGFKKTHTFNVAITR